MSDELPQGWAMPLLGEVVKIKQGNSKLTKKLFKPNAKYVAFSGSGPDGLVDEYEYEGKAIVLSAVGARCGKCFKAPGELVLRCFEQGLFCVQLRHVGEISAFW